MSNVCHQWANKNKKTKAERTVHYLLYCPSEFTLTLACATTDPPGQLRRKHLFFFAIAHRLKMNKMFYDNKRAEKRVSNCLGANNDVVDGNMDEFNEETNETHDGEPNGSCHRDLLKLL